MDQIASTAAPGWLTAPAPVPYPAALAEMQAHIAAMQAGLATERIWLLEHPPLYTAGTSAKPDDLQVPDRFPTFTTGRGGQWTYHGPGQRVVYIMLDLNVPHGGVPARDLHGYVEGLETWLIRALASVGVRGEIRAGRVGVWVANPRTGTDDKIGAIGVRVTRWVTSHGVSLNVNPSLDHFGGIVPCGIRAHGVTSLHALGVPATMAEVDDALRTAWRDVFGGKPACKVS
jgi:lipoyl(octanoyl) transferase